MNGATVHPISTWQRWLAWPSPLRRLGVLAILSTVGTLAYFRTVNTFITPPPQILHPVNVWIAEYSRHSSLLFPTADPNTMQEFAFGDFPYFALNKTAWYDGPRALLWSTRSALGRRTLHVNATDLSAAARQIGCDQVIPVPVEQERADALRRLINARWQTHADTFVHNNDGNLDLVLDDGPYSLGENCNQVTARWLADLGCDVRGPGMLCDFVVVKE